MTDKEKLKEITKLADAMYYAAFNLTTDASRLKKAMNEYRQFIINEYCKEEPVSEDLEEAAKHYLYSNILYDDVYVGNPTDKDCIEMFKAGAEWQKKTDESITNDLGEYLYELSKQFPEVSFSKLSRIGVRVAKWQKEHLRTIGDRTMGKAEKFISEYTRNCSNVFVNPQLGGTEENHPWLTPDQARRAVEIAREEIYEWLEENAANFVCLADDEHIPIGDTKAFYGTKSLIHYLKQAMKDE